MPEKMAKVPVATLLNMVEVTEDHGGYLSGRCLACGELGWLDGEHGYAAHHRRPMSNRLKHKKSCPLNPYIKKPPEDS